MKMTEREKLIAIIDDCRTYVAKKEELAVRLLANNVVAVVRCGKCKWWDPDSEYCQFWHGLRHPEHYCGEGEKK